MPIDINSNEIFSRLINAGFGGLLVFAFIFYNLFKNPDKVDIWVGMIARWLSYISDKFEYISAKHEIQGKINSFVNSLENNTTARFQKVNIKWIARSESEDIIMEDYETFIVMRDRRHRNKNFVSAAYLYTSRIMLGRAKRHLSPSLKKSIDLFAVKCILEKEHKVALEQFINDYLNPEIEKSEKIRNYIKKYVKIDKVGLFFPVLVQELTNLGNKALLSEKSDTILSEVNGLINFLELRAIRHIGDLKTPEEYIGNFLCCSIKIVATKQSRESFNIEGQCNRITYCVRKRCENIYLIGDAEAENKNFMNGVVNKALQQHTELKMVKDVIFKSFINLDDNSSIQVKTYFVHLHNPNCVEYIKE